MSHPIEQKIEEFGALLVRVQLLFQELVKGISTVAGGELEVRSIRALAGTHQLLIQSCRCAAGRISRNSPEWQHIEDVLLVVFQGNPQKLDIDPDRTRRNVINWKMNRD